MDIKNSVKSDLQGYVKTEKGKKPQLPRGQYRLSSHSVYNLNYHIVFTPKRRAAVLVGDIADELKRIFGEVAQMHSLEIEALEIMPDHVHLFVSCPPSLAPHKIVKLFKGNSSPILRRMFPQLTRMATLWNHAYYVGSVGHVSDSVVRNYIENQKGK